MYVVLHKGESVWYPLLTYTPLAGDVGAAPASTGSSVMMIMTVTMVRNWATLAKRFDDQLVQQHL